MCVCICVCAFVIRLLSDAAMEANRTREREIYIEDDGVRMYACVYVCVHKCVFTCV